MRSIKKAMQILVWATACFAVVVQADAFVLHLETGTSNGAGWVNIGSYGHTKGQLYLKSEADANSFTEIPSDKPGYYYLRKTKKTAGTYYLMATKTTPSKGKDLLWLTVIDEKLFNDYTTKYDEKYHPNLRWRKYGEQYINEAYNNDPVYQDKVRLTARE